MPHPQTAAPKHTGKEVTTNSQQYLYHLVSTHNPAWTHNVYFWRQALRPMWCCLSPFVWCFVSCFVFASICDDWVAGLARPHSSKLSAVEWKKSILLFALNVISERVWLERILPLYSTGFPYSLRIVADFNAMLAGFCENQNHKTLFALDSTVA